MREYKAPKLTKYGKLEDFIQVGSVMLQTGDLTGDGTPETAFDTDMDGRADVVVSGVSGTQTSVTFSQNIIGQDGTNSGDGGNLGDSVDLYDSDGDGAADFAIADLNSSPATLQRINDLAANTLVLSGEGFIYNSNINLYAPANAERSSNGGWDESARD